MKIETRPLTTSQRQRPCDSTFFLESHACLCFGKLVVNGRRGRAIASFIAPSAQFLHFSPKGRREMVFGRGQRQETGFVIAGYVLAARARRAVRRGSCFYLALDREPGNNFSTSVYSFFFLLHGLDHESNHKGLIRGAWRRKKT